MTSVSSTLSDADLENLAHYLVAWIAGHRYADLVALYASRIERCEALYQAYVSLPDLSCAHRRH